MFGRFTMSIRKLQLGLTEAETLYSALCKGIANSKGFRHSLELHLRSAAQPFAPTVSTAFYGWGSYVNVPDCKHNATEQSKHTTLLYRGEPGLLQQLRLGLPGFDALVRMAEDACPGFEVAFAHVLQQSSPQACFGWHTDTATEGYEDVRKTLVVLLSDTESSMQIEGRSQPFVYSGVGCAALFDSDCMHCSGPASHGTIKVALMLRPTVADSVACDRLGAVWRAGVRELGS